LSKFLEFLNFQISLFSHSKRLEEIMRIVGYSCGLVFSAILTVMFYWPSPTPVARPEFSLEDSNMFEMSRKSNGGSIFRPTNSTTAGKSTVQFSDEEEGGSTYANGDLFNNDGEGSPQGSRVRRRLMKSRTTIRRSMSLEDDGIPSIRKARSIKIDTDGTNGELRGVSGYSQVEGGEEMKVDRRHSRKSGSSISQATQGEFMDDVASNANPKPKASKGPGCFKRFLLRGSFRGGKYSNECMYQCGPWTSEKDHSKWDYVFNKFFWFGVVLPYALIVSGLVMCFMEKLMLGDILIAMGAFILILQPALSLSGTTEMNGGFGDFDQETEKLTCMTKFKLIFGVVTYHGKTTFIGIHFTRFLVHTGFLVFSFLCLVGMFDEEEEEESKEQAVEAVGDAKGDVEAPPAQKSAPEDKNGKEADKDAVVQVADSSSDAAEDA